MGARPITANMMDLLRHLSGGGELGNWDIKGHRKLAGALAFWAREKVADALIGRGLIRYDDRNVLVLTDAGRELEQADWSRIDSPPAARPRDGGEG